MKTEVIFVAIAVLAILFAFYSSQQKPVYNQLTHTSCPDVYLLSISSGKAISTSEEALSVLKEIAEKNPTKLYNSGKILSANRTDVTYTPVTIYDQSVSSNRSVSVWLISNDAIDNDGNIYSHILCQ